MAINSISSYVAGTSANTIAANTLSKKQNSESSTTSADTTESAGVVYEKSSSSSITSASTDSKTQNSALIAQLKADTDNRIAQLKNIVTQMMTKQGTAIGTADDMWKFLAGGNYTVSAETKAQAQADIADDGYWGVEQTSDRIVDFAKALSGNDSSKAEELLDSFKKGFEEATKSWGKTLPDISQQTYDSVVKKFNQWMNGEE